MRIASFLPTHVLKNGELTYEGLGIVAGWMEKMVSHDHWRPGVLLRWAITPLADHTGRHGIGLMVGYYIGPGYFRVHPWLQLQTEPLLGWSWEAFSNWQLYLDDLPEPSSPTRH